MEKQYYDMSRRSFIVSAGLISAELMFSKSHLFAQTESPVNTIIREAGKAPIISTKLRGNISILEGSGGNILVFTGREGKMLIDAGISVSEQKIRKALAEIDDSPIKHLINTHWHFDHASGNEWLNKAGAVITAHENTKKHLSSVVRVEDWNYTFPAAPKEALPKIVFPKNHHLEFNKEKIMLAHYEHAHTDSDISVHFPHADILHVADTWWNGYYPFIDYSTGGGIKGMIAAAEKNMKTVGERTIIIPGHGPVGNKSQLSEYLDMLQDVTDKISKLKASGHSMSEVVGSKPTKIYDAKWGTFVITGDVFTTLVYKGI